MLWHKLLIMINEIQQAARILSRAEMKKLKGGATEVGEGEAGALCFIGKPCTYREAHTGMVTGKCEHNSLHQCICNAGTSSVDWGPCYMTGIIIIGDAV